MNEHADGVIGTRKWSDAAGATHHSRKESRSGASKLPRKPPSIPYVRSYPPLSEQ
jgi:hypothetical protein